MRLVLKRLVRMAVAAAGEMFSRGMLPQQPFIESERARMEQRPAEAATVRLFVDDPRSRILIACCSHLCQHSSQNG